MKLICKHDYLHCMLNESLNIESDERLYSSLNQLKLNAVKKKSIEDI